MSYLYIKQLEHKITDALYTITSDLKIWTLKNQKLILNKQSLLFPYAMSYSIQLIEEPVSGNKPFIIKQSFIMDEDQGDYTFERVFYGKNLYNKIIKELNDKVLDNYLLLNLIHADITHKYMDTIQV